MELFARLENIEFQIKQLKQKSNALEQENQRLKAENKELNSKLNTTEHEVRSLAETNKITKIAQDTTSSNDNSELRLQIDSLIKEIDQCLSLIKE